MVELLLENRKGIYWATLNRPEVHNAFNPELIAQLAQAFERVAQDSSARAVVLMGQGKSFCAGADLNWMKGVAKYSREENYQDSMRLAHMLEAIQCCPVPVVGRVHGAALGGGVGLVAACDYVLMGEWVQWGLTEVHLGLVPAVISSAVIEKVGVGCARALFLTGERYDGVRAQGWGLAHEVFSDIESLDERLEQLLQAIKQGGANAQRRAKELIWMNQTFGPRPEKLRELTCQMIAGQRVSAEGQEGMRALLEKRNPKWEDL